MNIIVLPLSRVAPSTAAMTLPSRRINGVLAIVFSIGLTISLLVHRKQPALDASCCSWVP